MIGKYKKGDKIVQAVQWDANIESEELIQEFSGKEITFTDHPDFIIVLVELGKHLLLDLGDYLVKDEEGNLYVVEQDTFEQIYEIL